MGQQQRRPAVRQGRRPTSQRGDKEVMPIAAAHGSARTEFPHFERLQTEQLVQLLTIHWADTSRDLQWFALIDTQRFDSPKAAEQQLQRVCGHDVAIVNLYADLLSSPLIPLGPRLAEIKASVDVAAWVSGLLGMPASISLISCMPAHQPALVHHLLELREVMMPDGSEGLLRYHDTRMMSALVPLLTTRQLAALLGPARHWVVCGVCAEVGLIQTALEHSVAVGPLALSQPQLDAVEHSLLSQRILAQADAVDSSLLARYDECSRHRIIRKSLDEARSLGLTREEDLSLLCLLSLQLPPGFYRHPPFAGAIQQAIKTGASLGELLDEASPVDWEPWNRLLSRQSEGILQ
jgi:hypothetical protein